MYNKPRGTRDLYDEDMEVFEYIVEKAKEVFENSNISRIQTPVFEFTELFSRSVGDDTDIVQKEMYTFTDKGDRSLTLRPEGTAGVVRAFLENGMDSLPSPKKFWYMMPIYRYENVQKGRQREFHQIGLEYFGSYSYKADFEVIKTAIDILKNIGIFDDCVLKINSIGCLDCRNEYKSKLREELKDKISNYCDDCKRRYDTNVLRILDCKNEKDVEMNKELPSILEYLDLECKEHFNKLKELLDENNIKYEVDDKIVRGLDYYNKTVFEILNKDGLAVLAGGRYDGLSETIGEKKIPAVGYAMGVERIAELILEKNIDYRKKTDKIYIITEDFSLGFEIASKFRKLGIITEQDILDRSIRAQLKYASKQNFDYTIFANSKTDYVLKNLENGEELKFENSEKLIEEIEKIIK